MNQDLTRATLMLVGCGTMGASLLKAWLQQPNLFNKIIIVTPHEGRAAPFRGDPRVHWVPHPNEVENHAGIILFAVKPQVLPQIIHLYQRFVDPSVLFLTVVASLERTFYEERLSQPSLIRMMPNLPVTVRKGMSALCANAMASSSQQQQAEFLMRCLGEVIWVEDDHQLDIVTAVSGCGPAYVYLLAEALQRGAEVLGLDASKAAILARHIIIGSSIYLEQSEKSVQELRKQVTSPGGMTEAAVASLQQNGQFDKIFQEALKAAMQRAVELREQL